MTWVGFTVLAVALLVGLLASGVWIAIALLTTGIAGIWIEGGARPLMALGSITWNQVNSFTLTPVPLFIVMGAIILRCGIAERFYGALALWLRFLPGGLLQSNIVACSIFAAACGSSVATAGTIGTVTISQLQARGYNNPMIFGSIAAEKWDFTVYYGPGHSLTRLYSALCDDVRERTGGALDITLRPAGELPFSAAEAVTVAGTGQVPMALGYMGFIAGTTKIAALPGLPFLITDAAEAETAMGVLLPYVDKAVQQAGAKVLMWNGQHWPQNLYGRGDPITSLAQLKGRNARGSSPEQGDVIRHFGGAPVTLTTAEVPEAMNRDVMDAVFTGAANITGSRWNEFLDWGYLCRPNTGIEYIIVNQELYDDLAPEDQPGHRAGLSQCRAAPGVERLSRTLSAGLRHDLCRRAGRPRTVADGGQCADVDLFARARWDARHPDGIRRQRPRLRHRRRVASAVPHPRAVPLPPDPGSHWPRAGRAP